MKEKTKSRIIGIVLFLAGVSTALSGHAILALFSGIATGVYIAGWSVKTLGIFILTPGELEAVREEAFDLGRVIKEKQNE